MNNYMEITCIDEIIAAVKDAYDIQPQSETAFTDKIIAELTAIAHG